MRHHQHAAIGVDREAAQQPDELPHLGAVILVAGEDIGGGVDDDDLRLDAARLAVQAVE